MSDFMLKRECGTCSKCCEGHLEGNIYGQQMFRGRPCFFLKEAGCCSIYSQRPDDPCRLYTCEWKANDDVPMWMKPEQSHVIITKRTFAAREDLTHYECIEAGQPMTASALNWIVQWAIGTGVNVVYFVDGKSHRLGATAFTTATFPTTDDVPTPTPEKPKVIGLTVVK